MPLMIVAGLIMLIGGLRLRRVELPDYLRRVPWPAIILGACLLAAAPTSALYPLRLDPTGFEVRYGLWFLPLHNGVEFADLAAMRIETRIKTGRRSHGTRTVLVCTHQWRGVRVARR